MGITMDILPSLWTIEKVEEGVETNYMVAIYSKRKGAESKLNELLSASEDNYIIVRNTIH